MYRMCTRYQNNWIAKGVVLVINLLPFCSVTVELDLENMLFFCCYSVQYWAMSVLNAIRIYSSWYQWMCWSSVLLQCVWYYIAVSWWPAGSTSPFSPITSFCIWMVSRGKKNFSMKGFGQAKRSLAFLRTTQLACPHFSKERFSVCWHPLPLGTLRISCEFNQCFQRTFQQIQRNCTGSMLANLTIIPADVALLDSRQSGQKQWKNSSTFLWASGTLSKEVWSDP